jgi:8-oxo-dGTP pyrophosphatase MutT (NUDIX family)
MEYLDRLTCKEITESLSGADRRTSSSDLPLPAIGQDYRPAGVLLPLHRVYDGWHITFIRRAHHVDDHHSGQVAFAGGKHESGDSDLVETALREAHEEIGLHPDHVSVLGQLNRHYSVSGFRITPVVACIEWPLELRPEPGEVARIFSIPLRWLADQHHYRQEMRDVGGVPVPVVYYDEYDGELLWGATARMTLSLVNALVGDR